MVPHFLRSKLSGLRDLLELSQFVPDLYAAVYGAISSRDRRLVLVLLAFDRYALCLCFGAKRSSVLPKVGSGVLSQ